MSDPFKCWVCGLGFMTEWVKDDHVRRHSDEEMAAAVAESVRREERRGRTTADAGEYP